MACSQPDVDPLEIAAEPEPALQSLAEVVTFVNRDGVCEDYVELELGDSTVLCDGLLIQHWDEQIPAVAISTWAIWCQPVLAPESLSEVLVSYGPNWIASHQLGNQVVIPGDDLCADIAATGFIESSETFSANGDTLELLANFASRGVCLERPEFFVDELLQVKCRGFAAGGVDFSTWLEFGDVAATAIEYSAECSAGIFGTFGDGYLISSYDQNALLSENQTVADLIIENSPIPFEMLC